MRVEARPESSEESSSGSSGSTVGEQTDTEEDELNSEVGDEEHVQRPSSPSTSLVSALEVITLASLRMQKTGQLPFLLRNLRRGFQHRCSLVDAKSTGRHDESAELLFTFRLIKRGSSSENEFSDEYSTRMNSWNCPLCDLHGQFKNIFMLKKHLEWDHFEVRTDWSCIDNLRVSFIHIPILCI